MPGPLYPVELDAFLSAAFACVNSDAQLHVCLGKTVYMLATQVPRLARRTTLFVKRKR